MHGYIGIFPLKMSLSDLIQNAKLKFGATKPYSIQTEFATDMIKAFQENKIGFFESPTGTGKSMSVLTSSLAFIQEKNKDIADSYAYGTDNDDIADILYANKPKRSKLIVCTRTHSQIKELVNELKRPSLLRYKDSRRTTRCISLASRRFLCINDVYANYSGSELNNVCKKSCDYYKNFKDRKADILKKISTEPHDIEDLMSFGRAGIFCPYFASRATIRFSDVILMPYQTLFQQQTLESLKIDISNAYIVIDEGHNLVDALNSMYSISLTKAEDITGVTNGLKEFQMKLTKVKGPISEDPSKLEDDKKPVEETPQNQLKKEIMMNMSTLNRIATGIISVMNKVAKGQLPKVMEMNDFQESSGLRNINPFILLDFVHEKSLVYRICGKKEEKERLSSTTAFRKLLQFVEAMGNPDKYGRVIVTENSVSYMLLNPSLVFAQVAKTAKSVCLVGGTLQPFSDLTAQLIDQNSIPEDRIFTHVNGHVILAENALTFCLHTGPNKEKLGFTYETRQNERLFDEIGQSCLELSCVVPGGIIYFFTSFDILNKAYKYIETKSYKEKIENHKFILKETQNPNDLDKLMRTFKSHIDKQRGDFTGAVLFAVMNGKLSEGINFANDYCRCVVCVGMPFSNMNDMQISERMKFFDQMQKDGISSCGGRQFVENTCMRIVNQSIGRSFRNIKDYAVAILFDERYNDHKQLLPGWIQRNYQDIQYWNDAMNSVKSFFNKKH